MEPDWPAAGPWRPKQGLYSIHGSGELMYSCRIIIAFDESVQGTQNRDVHGADDEEPDAKLEEESLPPTRKDQAR